MVTGPRFFNFGQMRVVSSPSGINLRLFRRANFSTNAGALRSCEDRMSTFRLALVSARISRELPNSASEVAPGAAALEDNLFSLVLRQTSMNSLILGTNPRGNQNPCLADG